MAFVVDASMALAWCFEDESTPFTVSVLDKLRKDSGVVPGIWPFEIANSLLSGERRGRVTRVQADGAIALLRGLPIVVEDRSIVHTWTSAFDIARSQRLTAYDACYLDLAVRAQLPLATLDARLRDAATRLAVPLVDTSDYEPK